MILHKENTVKLVPYFQSLMDLAEERSATRSNVTSIHKLYKEKSYLLEKYSYMVQNVILFEEEIRAITEPEILVTKLNLFLRKILPVKDSGLFFFDDSMLKLVPVNKLNSSDLTKTLNNLYKESVLNMIFESGKEMVIPDLESYSSDGSRLNYLLYPVIEMGKDEGVLAILTSVSEDKLSGLERKSIRILLNAVLSKIEKAFLKKKLNSTYHELQTYQAKLSNDFRLSAIGELTNGVLEDILSPMQVIVSQLDMLKVTNGERKELNKIKRQVKKINKSIDRLIKFADVNHEEVKVMPCKINEVTEEYFTLVKSTLEGLQLECILDLQDDIPSILSHPNYIFQLLTNIFEIISNNNHKPGGVIIQTRFKTNNVIFRVITTNILYSVAQEEQSDKSDLQLNYNIIEKIMLRHEGSFNQETFENGGSAIVLNFPLKRRVRK